MPLVTKLLRPVYQHAPVFKRRPTLENWVEKPRPTFYVPEGTTNLALHKKVTSSDAEPIVGQLARVTDGDKDYDSHVELNEGLQWVQIDLGATYDIYAVLVWHSHMFRVYHDVIVQVSDDSEFQKGVATVFNNDFDNSSKLGAGKNLEYIDEYRGKLIDAKDAQGKPVRGRYVRLYSNGNTSNDQNHYVEVEVFGKPAK